MTITMNKELLIRIPASLYNKVRIVCKKEYKSMSALMRELLLEKMEDSLTASEMALVEKESKSFHAGKGTDWRKIKRG